MATMGRPYSTLVHVFAAGCAAIVIQMALCALLIALAPSPEWIVAAVAFSFLLGVPLGVGVTRALHGLTFPTIGLLALSGIASAFVIDVPLWGRVVELNAEAGAQVDPGAAGYVAPGWRIDESAALEERISSGRGRGRQLARGPAECSWSPQAGDANHR